MKKYCLYISLLILSCTLHADQDRRVFIPYTEAIEDITSGSVTEVCFMQYSELALKRTLNGREETVYTYTGPAYADPLLLNLLKSKNVKQMIAKEAVLLPNSISLEGIGTIIHWIVTTGLLIGLLIALRARELAQRALFKETCNAEPKQSV